MSTHDDLKEARKSNTVSYQAQIAALQQAHRGSRSLLHGQGMTATQAAAQQTAFTDTSKYMSPASKMMLLFGDQKSGKTSCIATAPLDWRIHIIDVDGGLEPMLTTYQERGGNFDNLTVAPASTYPELHAAMWHLPPGHDLYVIDTYTTAMKRFKSHVTNKMGIKPNDLIDWKKIGGSISAMAMDYLDHWRELVGQHNAWGLIICQDKPKDFDTGGPPKLAPDLVGAAARDATGMVNELLHLESRRKDIKGQPPTVERYVRTAETATVMAGDRSRTLAATEPADLTHILNKIQTGRTEVAKAFNSIANAKE